MKKRVVAVVACENKKNGSHPYKFQSSKELHSLVQVVFYLLADNEGHNYKADNRQAEYQYHLHCFSVLKNSAPPVLSGAAVVADFLCQMFKPKAL